VGHAGELEHREPSEPEDLSAYRCVAQPGDSGDFPYVYLDGVVLKRSWAGEVRNISVLVAIGVGTEGFRQILGVAEGEAEKEDLEGWRRLLRHLRERGLKGVQLIISAACRGLVEAAPEFYPEARWQRCVVHF